MSAVELYNAAVALGRNEARSLVAESICSEATKQEVLERLGLRADEVEHEPKRQPGDEIAHYVVTGELGRGGMGVVYSATDTFLGREVALKFVSKATLKDSAAALLEREAKTACALNHPNIVTVHEVIRAGTGVAIVMEKVEGVSLRKFMADARGTRSVVEIGRQIALATAAAHSHGIIHRDLKPENVMVRPDGYVKVLDFGLARQADAGAGATSRAWAGTLRYMSPEQANAEPLTPASDVYSLGLILYEMCAGRHAFQTESALATVHAIATRDAQALSVTCAGMPEWLSELIGSMLRRDPAARPTARSVAEALHSGTLPRATVEGDPVARTIAADRPTVTRRVWIGMATAALGAIAYLEFKRPAGQPKAVVDTRVDLATAGELEEEGFALSPDGQTLLVVAAGQLKYVSLAGGGATVWEGAAEGRFPFWSPDGREAGFYWKNKLWRKGFPNGPLREICEASEPVAASWGSRDTIVFSAGDGPIKHVPASGGTPVAVTRLNGALFDAAPTFLPDGVRFVFYRAMDPSEGALMTGTTDGTNATARLGPAATSAVYVAGPQSSPGALVYTRQGKLLAHPFDLSRAGFAGSPYIVTERAREFRRRVIPASAAAGGAFVYVAEEDKRDHAKIFNRAGRLIARLGPRREYIRARPSPDFQRIAMASRDPATMQHQLELLDRRSGATQALGSPELMRVPVWSPDGTKIAFTTRSGTSEYVLTIQNAAERNSKTTLRLLPYDSWPHDWSPDGTLLLVTAQTSGVDRSVWALPLDPARVPFPIVRTPGKNDEPHWSPDGRFIAYQSNESGRTEVHVIPFPPDGRRWQVSTEGGQEPRWRADGKELYFLSLDYALMVSSTSLKGKDFSFGPPTMLFGGRSSEPSLMVWHAEPSPDGREFLILTSARSAGSTMRLRLNGWAPGGDADRGR